MRWAVKNRRLFGYGWKISCAVLLLLLFGLTWFYQARQIPFLLAQQEQKLRSTLDLSVMDTVEVVMVQPDRTLEKGTHLTENNNEDFILSAVPEIFLPDMYLTSMEELFGRNLGQTVVGGEIITPTALIHPQDRTEGYYRLVQIPVKDFMLGALDSGTFIDLLADDGQGDYQLLVSKVPVHQVGLGDDHTHRILLPLDEEEQRRAWKALEHWPLKARLYLDIDQPPSPLAETIDATKEENSGVPVDPISPEETEAGT